MKISLIVMDMDGTLLGRDLTCIPEENIAALREAAEAGIQLALCSGRVPDDVSLYALDAGLPTMHILALNGTCMLDAPLGKMVRSIHMPDDVAARLVPILDETGLQCGYFSDHILSVTGAPADPVHPESTWGSNIARSESRACFLHYGEGRAEAIAQGLNKIVVLDKTMTHDLPSLADRLKDEFPELDISSSWPDNIEINARGINKGKAVAMLAETLGIPMNEVMCIGDHNNDLSMLRVAGCSVVMGNGSPEALDAAGWIAPSNIQNGVAAAIRHIALGRRMAGVRRLV